MYGMVNKFFVQGLVNEYGSETWDKIEKQSGVNTEFFVGLEQYPDQITYDIVGAAAEVLEISADQVLEMFGKNWVEVTAKGEYGHYYALADDLFEFLENLDSMHKSLAAGMPELRPPSFTLFKPDDNTAQLQYVSDRPGLTPFVLGLIKGLADHYGQAITVEITAEKQSGAEQDQFRIAIR